MLRCEQGKALGERQQLGLGPVEDAFNSLPPPDQGGRVMEVGRDEFDGSLQVCGSPVPRGVGREGGGFLHCVSNVLVEVLWLSNNPGSSKRRLLGKGWALLGRRDGEWCRHETCPAEDRDHVGEEVAIEGGINQSLLSKEDRHGEILVVGR